LLPSPGDSDRLDSLVAELDSLRRFRMDVLLAFGLPIPAWMGSEHPWCPMPESDSGWTFLASSIARVASSIATRLASKHPSERSWYEKHLRFEPFNEFDALSTPKCVTQTSLTGKSTPARGADLQRMIQSALLSSGLDIRATSPSLVGGWSSSGVTGQDSSLSVWLTRYYAAGGGGSANIHVYRKAWDSLAPISSLLGQFRHTLEFVDNSLPDSLRGRIVLGETGVSAFRDGCSSSTGYSVLGEKARGDWYATLASDSVLNSHCEAILLWRLRSLPPRWLPSNPCESTYGLLTDSGTASLSLAILGKALTHPTSSVESPVHGPSGLLMRWSGSKLEAIRWPDGLMSSTTITDFRGHHVYSSRPGSDRWIILPKGISGIYVVSRQGTSILLAAP